MISDLADFIVAKAVAPYGDESYVADTTAALASAGHRVLQIFQMGATERAHVGALLDMFDPPEGALVLDAGCGIGAVADLMSDMRPDLRFVLLNVSLAQLEMCRGTHARVAADFHRLPVADGSVDAVLFTYSLGHGLLDVVLTEAVRVLKPGGMLFIYDLASENSATLIRTLGYKAHAPGRVMKICANLGLRRDFAIRPDANVDGFMRIMDRTTFGKIFAGIVPAAYRFERAA